MKKPPKGFPGSMEPHRWNYIKALAPSAGRVIHAGKKPCKLDGLRQKMRRARRAGVFTHRQQKRALSDMIRRASQP